MLAIDGCLSLDFFLLFFYGNHGFLPRDLDDSLFEFEEFAVEASNFASYSAFFVGFVYELGDIFVDFFCIDVLVEEFLCAFADVDSPFFCELDLSIFGGSYLDFVGDLQVGIDDGGNDEVDEPSKESGEIDKRYGQELIEDVDSSLGGVVCSPKLPTESESGGEVDVPDSSCGEF